MHCSVMAGRLEAAIDNYRTGARANTDRGTIVCTCFGVTDKEIERVVRENDLTTVEQVTNYCKAGGGCGGCHGEIEKIIERIQGERAREQTLPPPRKGGKLTTIQKIQLIQQTINEQIRPACGPRRQHQADRRRDDKGGHRLRSMCAQCKVVIHDEGCGRGQAARVRLRSVR
jgi:NifU-like protein